VKARYRKKATQIVAAVQLDLETDGFSYEKWGGSQTCRKGDWLVDNDGDVYTIDRQVFAATYEKVGLGQYAKTQAVWAEAAEEAGVVKTIEGSTEYEAGDYLVYNDEAGKDKYAVSRDKFESMYEKVEHDSP